MSSEGDQQPEKRNGWKTLAIVCGGALLVGAVLETGFRLVDPDGYERASAEREKSGGIGYGGNHVVNDTADASIAAEPDDHVSALPAFDYRDIQNAYKSNEIAAERRFGDLAMRVTGPVRKINSSFTGKATVWLGDDRDFLGTMVNLGREHTDYAAGLVPGIEITLECSGARSTLGAVSLQDCHPAT